MTVAAITVVIVLAVGAAWYAAYATNARAPTQFSFFVQTSDDNTGVRTQTSDPVTIDCMGLTKDDLMTLLVPKSYSVSISKQNLRWSDSTNSCSITDYDTYTQPIGTMIRLRTPMLHQVGNRTSVFTEDDAKQS
ncbi:MAG: hypothetical protein FWD80_01580 [Propionibacteriaceae bacterium]|nr:hypothetical protein [Propionibacteriaceae bacterium]